MKATVWIFSPKGWLKFENIEHSSFWADEPKANQYRIESHTGVISIFVGGKQVQASTWYIES